MRCSPHVQISACSDQAAHLLLRQFISFLLLVPTDTSFRFSDSMAQPRVLLLGGHGKISMLMTPILLSRSWRVTSIIRNPDHREEVMKLGREYPGKLDVLVDSVEKYKEAKDAKGLLEKTRPDYVIWAAGADTSDNVIPDML